MSQLNLFCLSFSQSFLGLKNAFKVLLFPETHVYQADNKQLKVIILYISSQQKIEISNIIACQTEWRWKGEWSVGGGSGGLWRNNWGKGLGKVIDSAHVTVHMVKTKLNVGDYAFGWSIPFIKFTQMIFYGRAC